MIEQRGHVTKYEVMDHLHCDIRTAARNLNKIYVIGRVRIARYERQHGGATPVFVLCDGKQDAPALAPLSPAERARQRRANPNIRKAEAAKKRNDRLLANPPKLGFWGL